ncbi:sensor histidine kinase [Agromyces agglutinans]|nr:histidine kinase [Agromyces agglutinans]
MPVEPSSRSVQSTWLYTLSGIVFFIGFFAVFVTLLLLEGYSVEPRPMTLAVIVLQLVAGAVQVRYCWFLRAGRAGGLPAPFWTLALIAPAAAVWVLGLFVPGGGFLAGAALWAAGSLVACLVPRRTGWLVLGASALLFLAHPMIAARVTGEPFAFAADIGAWPTLIYGALLPVMLLTSIWWWQIVVELDRHRRAAAELAVTQERLRFASDLHDIQGHHLQVISLKSELAERLLAIDPDAARDHIHEVRLIAKQALEETRSLVAGYRKVALDDELENAREVLTAAGAQCDLRLGELRLGDSPADASARSVLASVVREATTNILRHSEATRVSITLSADGGWQRLEIANDGVADAPDRGRDAAAGSGADGAAGSSPAAGSGLAGLRERLAAVGGSLETTTDAPGRFLLRASVPIAAEVTA